MAKRKRRQPLKSPRRRPEILLDLNPRDSRIDLILELARDREWRMNLRSYCHEAPLSSFSGVITTVLADTPFGQELQQAGCPSVRLGNFPHPQDSEFPAVLPDLAAAGRMAAEHFAKRQFKDIAFVAYRADIPGHSYHPLYEGFRSTASESGMDCRYHSTAYKGASEDSSEDRAKHRAKDILKLVAALPKPVGLFTFSDGMAWQICRTCSEAGVRMPEEVAILGYGNGSICELVPVHISAVSPETGQTCRQALNLLQDLMDGKPAPAEPIMVAPARVIDRESTDVLASSDPVVSKALRFMWDHLDQDLSVADVVGASGVSHSTLQRRLQRSIGRGIIAELRRKRLERACELLVSSDFTVAEIAAETGFSTKNYLHRVFHNAFDMTPRAYRQQHSRN